MTSLDLFSACLVLGGLAAAGVYTYALNRSSSRPKDADADGLSDPSARKEQHRHQADEEKLKEAVERIILAAASAEAAAARVEAVSQAQGRSQIKLMANIPAFINVGTGPLMSSGGTSTMRALRNPTIVSGTEGRFSE